MTDSKTSEDSIRLFIADDHSIVREGMRRLVQECPDIELVGETADGHELPSLLRRNRVDVLLLDISMAGPGFLETLKQISRTCPRTRVLVVSMQPESVYAIRALLAGARGYLAKDRSPQELPDAVRRVHQGDWYVSQEVADKIDVDTARSPATEDSGADPCGM